MKTIWERIETWLKQHATDTFQDLRPGAADGDVRQAEAAMSCTFPAPMTESYRVHDGQRGGSGPLMASWQLLSLGAAVKEWTRLKGVSESGSFRGSGVSADPGVQRVWWSPKWIPVASNSSGDFVCVDLAPAAGGTAGQMVTFLHADPNRKRAANDFKAWLSRFADDLDAGRYKVEDGWLTRTG